MYIKEYFIFLVALTPEIYSIHGGPFVLSLEGRREHTFLWLFCSAGLFFRLLSFLRKAEIIHVAWTVPPTPPPALSDGGFTPQSKCLLGSPSAFFSQTSELNQVSFHPSVFLFLLFFKRSCVSTAPRLTSLPPFSIFPWNLTLYVPLSLLASSVFPLLLTSFPPHVHVPRCPALPLAEKLAARVSPRLSRRHSPHRAPSLPPTLVFLLLSSVPDGARLPGASLLPGSSRSVRFL